MTAWCKSHSIFCEEIRYHKLLKLEIRNFPPFIFELNGFLFIWENKFALLCIYKLNKDIYWTIQSAKTTKSCRDELNLSFLIYNCKSLISNLEAGGSKRGWVLGRGKGGGDRTGPHYNKYNWSFNENLIENMIFKFP